MLHSKSRPDIRHPEELSLSRPLEESHLKFNYGEKVSVSSITSNGHGGGIGGKKKPRRRITLPSMNGGGTNGHNGHHANGGGGHRATSTHSLLLMEPANAAVR